MRELPSMCLMLSLLLNVESEEQQATKSSRLAMAHHSFEDQTSSYILVITLEMMTKIFSSVYFPTPGQCPERKSSRYCKVLSV